MAELHESPPSQRSRQWRAGGHLVLPAGSEMEIREKKSHY